MDISDMIGLFYILIGFVVIAIIAVIGKVVMVKTGLWDKLRGKEASDEDAKDEAEQDAAAEGTGRSIHFISANGNVELLQVGVAPDSAQQQSNPLHESAAERGPDESSERGDVVGHSRN